MIETFKMTFRTEATDRGLVIMLDLYCDKGSLLAGTNHMIEYKALAAAGRGAGGVIANVKRDLVRMASAYLFPED